MICLALGLGILGFAAMRHARRCRYYHSPSGWEGRPWHHHWHGYDRHTPMGRRGLYMALSRLDASPAQERAIIGEVDKLKSRLRETRHGVKDARGDLAAAVRGPVLDDAALGAVLGRVDAATSDARNAIVDALRNIHGVLDDKQREQVSELIEHGLHGSWRRGGSPYRM
jgi:Spy/CpxP family protein refolding chaperone